MQAIAHRPVCRIPGSYLGSIGCSFPRALESGGSGASPGDNITFHIGDSHDGVIETRLDESSAFANLLAGSSLPRHL